MVNYEALIPEMRGGWIDVDGWLYNQGSYELLIACGWLFWPTFIEYKGCIIRITHNDYEGNFGRLTSDGPVQRGYVEERLNRLELGDIFIGEKSFNMEQALHIGARLEQMWRAKLTVDFPDRKFHFSFIVHEDDNPEDLELTFCQDESYQITG
ncbi:MAG: hypothetical protein ACSHX6_10130 [Akkermansiaceae bacterium]